MSRKRVLLLDPAFSALPIYEYLASLDIELWVMGSRKDDVLVKEAGARWIEQDYSQVEAVRAWLTAHECTYVVPGCTDVSLSVAAAVGVSSLIDAPETIDIFGDKLKFKALCRELGLPAPTIVADSDLPRSGSFICKPADSFSGRGITTLDGADADTVASARKTAAEASPTGSVIFEEFIEGQLFSFTVFVEKHAATHWFFVKEGSSANRFAVDTSFVVRDMPTPITTALTRYAHLISDRLALRDGLLHIQFILRDNGGPFLIEATRRCPGDLYSMLIEYATGFPYAAKYASYFVGEQVADSSPAEHHIVRHTVTSARASINTGLRLIAPMQLRAFYPIQKMGEALLPNQKARSGLFFVEVRSQEEASDAYDAFLARSVYGD